jgi:hypothetical protein
VGRTWANWSWTTCQLESVVTVQSLATDAVRGKDLREQTWRNTGLRWHAALAARRFGLQDRAVLTGIQVAPLPLGLMIVEGAVVSAFRTGPLHLVLVGEIDVHLALLQFQFDSFDSPGSRNSQNLTVQFGILHLWILPWLGCPGSLGQKLHFSLFPSIVERVRSGPERSRARRLLARRSPTLDGEDRCETITGDKESAPRNGLPTTKPELPQL